ncbi:hypothetical protein PPGU19_032420 [Paraburkholderia sp. PGU19]|nr:hypothetical protein PPGU19_032420 [Paraburkholderia sp. PGU19]
MGDADQLQMTVEHAEHGVAAEIQHANVVFDDVVRRDLTEAKQAIVFVEFKEVSEQTLAVFLAEFPDQNRRAASDVQQAIDNDRLGGADSLQIHSGFSFWLCDMMRRNKHSNGKPEVSLGKTLRQAEDAV